MLYKQREKQNTENNEMDWIDIIIGAVSGGALVTLLTMPATIKKAKAEALAADLDNMLKAAEAWEKLADERQETNSQQEEIIHRLNEKIDYLYSTNSDWRDKYNAKCEELTSLRVKIATDEVKLCMVRGCKDRQPQSGY